MKKIKLISANKIYKSIPGLKFYHLEYLIRSGQLKVKYFGKGIPRIYPPDTIQKIKSILKKRADFES